MSLKDFIKDRQIIQGHFSDTSDIIIPEPELLIEEYDKGVAVADHCMIDELHGNFGWKRGFQNCWTGYPNDGKTLFTLFLMVIKAKLSNWKFVLWSPEMKSANFIDGKVKVNYNDMINEIIWILSGKTPYKHVALRTGKELIGISEYMDLIEWCQEHFVFIDPVKKRPEDIHALLVRIFEDQGFDAVFIDPFKNVEQDINKRDDIWLEQLFSKFKDLALSTNSIINWIAHPKANIQRIRKINGNDTLMPCDQFMLNGGAAWNNSMDGIYTIFRPELLTNIRSLQTSFINLKQRKPELVAHRGTVDDIVFLPEKRRYLFSDKDVLKPLPF